MTTDCFELERLAIGLFLYYLAAFVFLQIKHPSHADDERFSFRCPPDSFSEMSLFPYKLKLGCK